MTSPVSTLADSASAARALDLDVTEVDASELSDSDFSELSDRTPVVAPPAPAAARAPEGLMDGVVEELTHRLPTSELVKIIKGALECGRRNRPFTESDLLRAMTFGSTTAPASVPRGSRAR